MLKFSIKTLDIKKTEVNKWFKKKIATTNKKVDSALRWSVSGLVILPILFYICSLIYARVMIWF